MKLLICSDIHGDLESAKAIIDAHKAHGTDKIVILGDILYHGPRNDLPKTYAPKSVISLLNEYKNELISVRGNCDTEVDQMVLEFPVLADYAIVCVDKINMYLTHGHKYGPDNPPPLSRGDLLLCGHTHIIANEAFGMDNIYINPGSVALPKNGCPRSYMIYENRTFTVYEIDGKVYNKFSV